MKRRNWEGSAKDVAEDKRLAKAKGMSLKRWEKSDADKKHDAPKKRAARIAKMERRNERV